MQLYYKVQSTQVKDLKMQRFNQTIQKKNDNPKSYEQLRANPFPYLQECNRIQIFEFIHQLQADNQSLKAEITKKYPDQSFQTIIKGHKLLQLKRDMLAIHKQSVASMQLQLTAQQLELTQIKAKNSELEQRLNILQVQTGGLESELIDVEKEKRSLQFKLKVSQEHQNQFDSSFLFQNFYQDVKNILQNSL